MLSDSDLERYSRHLILPEVGLAGQQRLLAARVLVVGLGGLGSPAALYLAAAGIGTLGLMDGDRVELSNLQRQVIHTTPDLGRPKVESAAERLRALNPGVRLEMHPVFADPSNLPDLLGRYEVVLDCTDGFASKFLLNDACVLAGRPFIHAGILRYTGQVLTVLPGRSPCYRCLFQAPPDGGAPSCSLAGVLGVLAGTIGTLQATEALKLILGLGQPLTGRLLTYDALSMETRRLQVPRDPHCRVCGTMPTITSLVLAEEPDCHRR